MSKTYLYIRRQGSVGCDYTIGCGIDVQRIAANSMEDAMKKIINISDDWKESSNPADWICDSGLVDVQRGEYSQNIVVADLIEISGEVNMIPILKTKLAEIESAQKEIDKKVSEDIEFKKYEELKKKFEKKGK